MIDQYLENIEQLCSSISQYAWTHFNDEAENTDCPTIEDSENLASRMKLWSEIDNKARSISRAVSDIKVLLGILTNEIKEVIQ